MNKSKIILLVFLGLLAVQIETNGQDYQLTQFYSAPTLLNPGFTGNTVQSRFVSNYRNQWTNIPGTFSTYSLSYEHFASKINSGLGVRIMHDRAGSGGLGYSSVAVMYAYELQLNYNLFFRPGISMGRSFSTLNYNRLVFGDQLSRPGSSSTIEQYEDPRISYYDMNIGGVLYSHNFWFGLSASHVNKPNNSLLGYQSTLPMLISAHGGYRQNLQFKSRSKSRKAILYAFNYKNQLDFDQFDLGMYYEHDPLIIGFWYRGLPGVKSNEYSRINHDSFAILLGYQLREIKFGYSYDITISPLISNSGGSHEISIIHEFAKPKKRKYSNRKRIIPCARF
ncbi:MAG: type IX secretion system PorP/SprF family membrane protein [Patiriisocius sp.]|jgi:type IX secretion system PorP/SprF family membrane protein